MRTSHILAIALAIGAILWVASGQFGGEPAAPAAGEAAVDEPVEAAKVRVAPSQSQPYTVTLTVTGRTAASRELALRTETAGRIETIAVTEGGAAFARVVNRLLAANETPPIIANLTKIKLY